MKRALAKVWAAFKAFFASLGDDAKTAVTKHWIGFLGRVIMFAVPLIYIVASYIYKTPSKWTLPTFAWVPLFVFLVVYWGKLRTYLAIKVSQMQTENNIQKGKHAGAIIVLKSLQIASTILPFFLCYRIFAALEAEAMSVKNIFLFIFACECVGGFLVLIDTVKNVVDFSNDGGEE